MSKDNNHRPRRHDSSDKLARQNGSFSVFGIKWNQPHMALLLIIILQGCFMVFMAFQGPPAHNNSAKVSPRRQTSNYQYEEEGLQDADRSSRTIVDYRKNSESMRGVVNDMKQKQKELLEKRANQMKNKRPKQQGTLPEKYQDMVQVEEWDVNSQDFPGALHLHFENERNQPSFQLNAHKDDFYLNEKWEHEEFEAHERMVAKKKQIKSCQYYDEETGQIMFGRICFDPKRKPFQGVVAYNSQPFPRTWCGKTIPPDSVVPFIKRLCNETESARLLLPETDKPLGPSRQTLRKLPPVVFLRNHSEAPTANVQDCDVPCKFTMDTCEDPVTGDKLKGAACLPPISEWTVQDTDYKFRYSMLDYRNGAPEVGISRKAFREHQYYATRSFQSEIPLTTFNWDSYGGETLAHPHNVFNKAAKKGVCFIHVGQCMGEVRPGVWAEKIEAEFDGNFDYYGSCKFSMKPTPTSLDLSKSHDRQTIMGEYMFTLIIGISQTPDLISDLVFDALAAGSIPVYFGAPNIREHVPANSIIVGGEFPSKEDMAKYMNEIKASRQKWVPFHAWRDVSEGDPPSIVDAKYGFLKDRSSSSYCRMCRWVIAQNYGLKWNHEKQSLERPSFDRKFCVTLKDVMKAPFEELWMSDLGMQQNRPRMVCDKTSTWQTLVFDDLSLRRKVTSHDNGVIDMDITDLQSLRTNLRVVLRMDFRSSLRNAEGAHFLQPHQLLMDEQYPSQHIPLMSSISIQDEDTRITVITNWVTDLNTPRLEGKVDVLIKDLKKLGTTGETSSSEGLVPRLKKDELLRIRIIIEDVNKLRDASTEYTVSPFARLMMKDFLDPLMFFYIK